MVSTPTVPITQYMRPHGTAKQLFIERPQRIADLAARIIAAGFKFELRHLGDVTSAPSVSITINDGNADVDNEITTPGEAAEAAIDNLVERFAATKGIL